jgi:hypothetical protein
VNAPGCLSGCCGGPIVVAGAILTVQPVGG